LLPPSDLLGGTWRRALIALLILKQAHRANTSGARSECWSWLTQRRRDAGCDPRCHHLSDGGEQVGARSGHRSAVTPWRKACTWGLGGPVSIRHTTRYIEGLEIGPAAARRHRPLQRSRVIAATTSRPIPNWTPLRLFAVDHGLRVLVQPIMSRDGHAGVGGH